MKFAVPATLVLFTLCGTASAQTTAEGTIRGVIHDDQGGVLPGVTVVAASPTVAGSFTTVSDAAGSYRLLNLSPGEYSITAELQGSRNTSDPASSSAPVSTSPSTSR